MKISIIIYADSSDDLLSSCLDSINQQSRPADEIILMDTKNGGSRETIVYKQLKAKCSYHHHEKEKRYHVEIAKNRNQAADISTGDILLFLNDDIVLSQEHLQKMEILFQSNDIDVCIFHNRYLSQMVNQCDQELSNIYYIDRQHNLKYDYPIMRNKHLIRSRYPWGETNLLCYAVRAVVFSEISGFDEQLAIYAGSDADFVYRLYKKGRKIVYPPEMYVYVQQKERYPAVRWRASGAEYLAYQSREEQAMDWFSIKTFGKQLIDYNRYHSGKCMLSQYGEYRLAVQFYEPNTESALVLLVDCVPDVAKTQQILKLVRQGTPIYIVSLLLEKSCDFEKLMKALIGSNVIFCHWNHKEAWETLCQLLKLSMVVLRTSKNKELIDYINKQQAEWITRKKRLENEICNELDNQIAAQHYTIKCISESLPEVLPKSTVVDDDAMEIKKWDFQTFPYQHIPGFSLPPRTISFRLTYMCNLHCKMCGQWGINGIYKDKDKNFIKQYLPIEMLKRTVDETAVLCPGMYYIWGGEPLLHPDYIELIRYIKQKGIFCTTTTNGMLLKKYARDICEIGTTFIRISLDGMEQVHNSIRGNVNCFQTVLEGIREITRIKKEMNTVYPILECDSVIIKDNYRFIEEYVEGISKIEGIHSINFSHPIYSNHDVGHRHAIEYEKEFGVTASAWNGFASDEEKLDTEELIEIVARIQKKKYSIPVNFDPPMRTLDDIRLHYTNIEKLYSKRFCTVPWIWAEIHPDGKVSFCEDFCDYYIGNLYENDFGTIWNSEAAQKYRKVLMRRNQFPICSYCGLLCHDADF